MQHQNQPLNAHQMADWIFLSKNGQDQYVNMFAHGCGQCTTDYEQFDYDRDQRPLVIRGILKRKLMDRCWRDQRDFFYIDTGYFGNDPSPTNPNGWKLWHRIVPNNLQHQDIKACPDDRWRRHKISIPQWQRTGSKIIVAAPDEKPCKFYGINQDEWIATTMAVLRQHTDREIVLRQRPPNRKQRITGDRFRDLLTDTFAVVTFNSNAATEAIMHGVPAFVTAPVHAAAPVAETDITRIETPFYADRDLVQSWVNHLSYGQFHVSELRDGSAARFLKETQ